MKIIVKYFPAQHPPLLKFSIYDAPHRRMHVQVIIRYRQALFDACKAAGVPVPLEDPIDLHVMFVEPSSPDLGNLYLALERALDGGTLSKKTAVLADDALISSTTMSKFFPHSSKKK